MIVKIIFFVGLLAMVFGISASFFKADAVVTNEDGQSVLSPDLFQSSQQEEPEPPASQTSAPTECRPGDYETACFQPGREHVSLCNASGHWDRNKYDQHNPGCTTVVQANAAGLNLPNPCLLGSVPDDQAERLCGRANPSMTLNLPSTCTLGSYHRVCIGAGEELIFRCVEVSPGVFQMAPPQGTSRSQRNNNCTLRNIGAPNVDNPVLPESQVEPMPPARGEAGLDGDCTNGGRCAAGLYCNGSTCRTLIRSGDGGCCTNPQSCTAQYGQTGIDCGIANGSCASGLSCSINSNGKKTIGSVCFDSSECITASCDPDSHRCSLLQGKIGDYCEDNFPCEDGLYCGKSPVNELNECRKKIPSDGLSCCSGRCLDSNKTCTRDNGACVSGFSCELKVKIGAACSGDESCGDGNYCDGVCQVKIASGTGGCCSFAAGCVAQGYPSGTTCSTSNGACSTSLSCSADTNGLKPNGQTCESASECLSGVCWRVRSGQRVCGNCQHGEVFCLVDNSWTAVSADSAAVALVCQSDGSFKPVYEEKSCRNGRTTGKACNNGLQCASGFFCDPALGTLDYFGKCQQITGIKAVSEPCSDPRECQGLICAPDTTDPSINTCNDGSSCAPDSFYCRLQDNMRYDCVAGQWKNSGFSPDCGKKSPGRPCDKPGQTDLSCSTNYCVPTSPTSGVCGIRSKSLVACGQDCGVAEGCICPSSCQSEGADMWIPGGYTCGKTDGESCRVVYGISNPEEVVAKSACINGCNWWQTPGIPVGYHCGIPPGTMTSGIGQSGGRCNVGEPKCNSASDKCRISGFCEPLTAGEQEELTAPLGCQDGKIYSRNSNNDLEVVNCGTLGCEIGALECNKAGPPVDYVCKNRNTLVGRDEAGRFVPGSEVPCNCVHNACDFSPAAAPRCDGLFSVLQGIGQDIRIFCVTGCNSATGRCN